MADPLLHCTPSASGYNSLNDHCLSGFMRKPSMRRRLIEHGILTRDGHVRCSLQELNHYRDYLHRCYQKKMYVKKVSADLMILVIIVIVNVVINKLCKACTRRIQTFKYRVFCFAISIWHYGILMKSLIRFITKLVGIKVLTAPANCNQLIFSQKFKGQGHMVTKCKKAIEWPA